MIEAPSRPRTLGEAAPARSIARAGAGAAARVGNGARPQLREMDINPLIVDEQGAVAVDARIAIDQAANTRARAV